MRSVSAGDRFLEAAALTVHALAYTTKRTQIVLTFGEFLQLLKFPAVKYLCLFRYPIMLFLPLLQLFPCRQIGHVEGRLTNGIEPNKDLYWRQLLQELTASW